jgi:hypothetical protein
MRADATGLDVVGCAIRIGGSSRTRCAPGGGDTSSPLHADPKRYLMSDESPKRSDAQTKTESSSMSAASASKPRS